MPKNDIGGFFVSLGLNIDKNSFETGNRLIDGIGNSFNKLIGAARNAAVVLASTAVVTGKVESQSYKTATAIGISTEALDLWKASAKIAGVDANGLIGAMSRMSEVMNHMTIDGSGLEAYAEQLGKLGLITDDLDIEKLLKLKPDELMKEIISKAQQAVAGGESMTRVSMIVKDILGESGMNFFIELERQGKSITEFLAGVQKTQLTTAEDNEKANNFRVEADTLKVELESMSKLFGDSVGGALTDTLKDLNDFIKEHGDEIADWIRVLGEDVGKLVNKLVGAGQAAMPTVKKVGKVLVDSVTGTAEGAVDIGKGMLEGDMNKVVEGTKEMFSSAFLPITEPAKTVYNANKSQQEVQKRIREIVKNTNNGNPIEFSRLPKDLQEDVDRIGRHKFTGIKINDGIIRPDGQVTQVAPDDWVFAARNIGDMARAFIPQNHTAMSAGEYVINQTINIGAGNDMPQVLRQEAYRGTQEGLLALMEESSRRLQLMSGTR